MDPAFVKKEASWYKASLPYDNLSRLPPESLSESNPAFKQALHDFYFTTVDGELKTTLEAINYSDPWPVKEKRGRPKKREPTPEDDGSDTLTAGVPPQDREAFNAELRSFMEENCPGEIQELPNPIIKKTTKAAKAKKAVVSREKRAAAKVRSTMPPPPHTRNTRLKAAQAAQAVEAVEAPDVQGTNGDVAATQNAIAVVAAPEADQDPGRARQHSAPPFNSFMRDTRAAMTRNAYMSRPVRDAESNTYQNAWNSAWNSIYNKPRSVGDDPIGNDIPNAPANAPDSAAAEPIAPTYVASKNAAAVPAKSTASEPVTYKARAPKKPAAPKHSAATETATSKVASTKPAAPKPAAPKHSAATETATSKAASTKPVNSGQGKDKLEAVKLPRAAKACDPCRSHKTRCTGGTPCHACSRRGFDCVYAPDGRKAPLKRAREESEDVVKNEALDKDDDQESRPAKRQIKLKLTFKRNLNDSNNTAGATNAQLSSALPDIEEVPEGNTPNGRTSEKRAREEDQEAVKQQPGDKDTDQDSRPAKRARKLKTTSTKEKSTEENPTQERTSQKDSTHASNGAAGNLVDGQKTSKKRAREDEASIDKSAEQGSRPAKRARKSKVRATREKSTKKDSTEMTPFENGSPGEDITNRASTNKGSTHGSHSAAGTIDGQPPIVLPSIEELPEEHEEPNAQPSKVQQFSRTKNGGNSSAKPTKIQTSYSGRITRSRSRQLSEEPEAQAAKLQHKGKRAREETEDPQERPAKLQRSSGNGPNWPKPAGNPQILRAIDSMRIDFEGKALTDDPWDNYPWEPSWMSNTYFNWEKSYHYPDLNLQSQEESFHARPSIKLVMTDVLKGILVDDWEHVTKDSQLVPLPHEQPVVKILNDYLEDEMPKREEDSAQMDILKETMAGLREYFDRALGRILLYRFERLQYSELLPKWENEKDGGPSSVYGGEHLCRLLVSLPELLAQTNMDQQSVSRLREELTKFTNWLSKNGQKYFVREYEVPGPEYQDKAKSS
ncbi:histone acetylase complex subunit [Diaporthe helianthi]|uniref:Chromatin modification-related protein EAF3 n=1 Tax=Diaporthe helianthi TaxID=158607 RepID=A0A2P5I7E3_DIAHE|nr:histone acetylase complex subunit [Diaporthe helianthi]